MRTAARDLAEYGITANTIRPLAAWRGSKEITPSMAVNLPEDVAPLVAYLASEQADNVTGRTFEVWHGHVGIFVEPPPVEQIIRKQGSWTLEELAKLVPDKLTKCLKRTVFAEVKMHD
jgi:3-oxoacyl-[acyl-carrier protein] reductase